MKAAWPTIGDLATSGAAFFEPHHVAQASRIFDWGLETLLPRTASGRTTERSD